MICPDCGGKKYRRNIDERPMSIEDASEYPKNIQRLVGSGRYNVFYLGFDESLNRHLFEYEIKGTEGWVSFRGIRRDPDTGQEWMGRPVKYNLKIATPRETESKWGIEIVSDLKPGWFERDELKELLAADSPLMYRGMSWEEWESIRALGKIESGGQMNLGPEQAGLTYYSSDPLSAVSYASSFAPVQFKATPEKPAIIIAVKRRVGIPVGGTGEHEIGIRGSIPIEEIVGVWEGHPYSTTRGSADVIVDWHGTRAGSGSGPSTYIAWRDNLA